MDGHVLAYQVVVADDECAPFPLELHVLRLAAQSRVLKDAVAATERSEALDNGVRADLASVAYENLFLDDGVRAYAHARAQLRARTDDSRRMNLARHVRRRWYIKSRDK